MHMQLCIAETRPDYVRPSQSDTITEIAKEIKHFLARRLQSAYPTLCFNGIRLSPKIRVLLCRILSQIPNVSNFSALSAQQVRPLSLTIGVYHTKHPPWFITCGCGIEHHAVVCNSKALFHTSVLWPGGKHVIVATLSWIADHWYLHDKDTTITSTIMITISTDINININTAHFPCQVFTHMNCVSNSFVGHTIVTANRRFQHITTRKC